MINLIKRLMPLMAAMAMALSAQAALQYVVVSEGEHQSTVFALEAKPTVNFTTTDLVVTGGDKTVCVPLTKKVSFSFSEDITAIEQILAQPNSISFCWNGGQVEFAGLKPFSKVALYQADGKMLNSVVCDSEGSISLDVESYKGVIIISTETKAFKIVK